ncbi:c-type cytochrome [Vulgatibacter sp.]|uniref:c-type cytochrome n=1 Tax=Vulgatibacter sp. TaxID=1971226 RepID=UPI00356605BD
MSIRRHALVALLVAGCDDRDNLVPPDWDLNRMIEQPRYDPFERSPFFADGRTMQAPPAGTVPRERVLGPPARTLGLVDGEPVETIPLQLTADLLERGRKQYGVFCAPCHGADGSGETVVADNMPLVKPVSFHSPTIRAKPPGHLYRVVSEGYGMMPRYAYQLDIEERWAVVAYMQALQRSRSVRLADLPSDLRRKAIEELPP